jgi:hypothetical protein
MDARRGTAEVQLLGERDEVPQLPQLERQRERVALARERGGPFRAAAARSVLDPRRRLAYLAIGIVRIFPFDQMYCLSTLIWLFTYWYQSNAPPVGSPFASKSIEPPMPS